MTANRSRPNHRAEAATKTFPGVTGKDTATALPPHEPSAWLRQTATRRLAQIDALNLDARGAVIVAPLVGAVSALGGRADRTCDRCSTYVPEGTDYYPGPVVPRVGVVLIMGLCQTCRDLEVGQ